MKTLLSLMAALTLTAGAASAQYHVAGDFNGWDANINPMFDDGTNGDLVAGDGIHTLELEIAAAGRHEWKAAEAGWANSWPGSGNSWFITPADNTVVTFTFDTNVMGDGWAPDGNSMNTDYTRGTPYTLVGSLGDELGGNDWDPTGVLQLTDDGVDGDVVAGDGVYTFEAAIGVTGSFEWKIAVNGGWGEQYGVDGPGTNSATWLIDVTDVGTLTFLLDVNTGRISYSLTTEPVDNDESSFGAVKSVYQN